ncbi:MAG: insulinase family protein, partial [Gillisia sp.]
FEISSGVRSNITYEALELIKQIMDEYPENFDLNDLEVTKGYMVKSNARKFETLQAKLGMLSEISNYDLPNDYIQKREEKATNFTLEDIQELARKYINPERMIYLIVGDAETQLEKLENLGFGKPVLLNR